MPKALLVLHVNLWQEWVALRLERIHHFPKHTISQTIISRDNRQNTTMLCWKPWHILMFQTYLSNMAFPCLLLILILPVRRSKSDWWWIFQNSFNFLFTGDFNEEKCLSQSWYICLYKICDVFLSTLPPNLPLSAFFGAWYSIIEKRQTINFTWKGQLAILV